MSLSHSEIVGDMLEAAITYAWENEVTKSEVQDMFDEILNPEPEPQYPSLQCPACSTNYDARDNKLPCTCAQFGRCSNPGCEAPA